MHANNLFIPRDGCFVLSQAVLLIQPSFTSLELGELTKLAEEDSSARGLLVSGQLHEASQCFDLGHQLQEKGKEGGK